MIRYTLPIVLAIASLGTTTANSVAVSKTFQTESATDNANDDSFANAWQRTENLFETYAANSIEPVVRQQFVLETARIFYSLSNQSAPAELSLQASELTNTGEFEKWLAGHWEQSGVQAVADRVADENNSISDRIAFQLIRKLAPGAQYETAKSNRVSKQLAENQYVGIGIRVRWVDDKAMIDEPFPGGAAFKAGSVKGDFIMQVDGESMLGMNLGQIIDVLRGPEGSKVSVVVKNQDGSETRQLDMVRTVIPIPSVQGVKQNDDGSWQFTSGEKNEASKFAYLRINSVVGSTSAELKAAAQKIIADGVQGVVLDLRDLVDGDLHHVNMIADVLTEDSDFGVLHLASGVTRTLQTTPRSDFENIPIAVLTPRKSVSGTVLALLASLKSRNHTQTIGGKIVSGIACRGSFDLPSNDGAIANLAYARLLPPGIKKQQFQRTDLSGHVTAIENGQVQFSPQHAVEESHDPMEVAKAWLTENSEKDASNTSR